MCLLPLAYALVPRKDAKRLQAPGLSHPDSYRFEGDLHMSVPVRRRSAAVLGGVAAALLGGFVDGG